MTDAADELERVFRARHSCRAFLATPLAEAVIERILGIAQLTPSWCNAQPWGVTVTRGAGTERFRAALLAHVAAGEARPDIAFPAEYRGAYRERRRGCAVQLYDAVGVTLGDRAASAVQARENFRLFGAPHVAIVTTDAALGTYGAVDCGAYVTAFMLAATTLGVATIAQASLAAYSDFLRAHLGIPDGRQVVCGIAFGHADTGHPANAFRTPRAALAEAVTWRDA